MNELILMKKLATLLKIAQTHHQEIWHRNQMKSERCNWVGKKRA